MDAASTNELPRRTRRTSGHVDAAVVEESESEDTDTLESDGSAEPEATQAPLRSRLKGVQERNRREARRRAESRMKIDETSDAEAEKDVEEPRRGRRLRKTIGKMQEVKSEPESDEEQPKGRDFDLNQIRSELKGFDKAVKLEIANVGPDPEEEEEEPRTVAPVKQEKLEAEKVYIYLNVLKSNIRTINPMIPL
jgi:Ras-related protein Rab-1A